MDPKSALLEVIHKHRVATRPTTMIKGGGTGLSDSIPAVGPGGRPIALAEDEHITPADVVSMLGDGSSAAGHKRMKHFHQAIREQKAQSGPRQASKISWDKLAARMKELDKNL